MRRNKNTCGAPPTPAGHIRRSWGGRVNKPTFYRAPLRFVERSTIMPNATTRLALSGIVPFSASLSVCPRRDQKSPTFPKLSPYNMTFVTSLHYIVREDGRAGTKRVVQRQRKPKVTYILVHVSIRTASRLLYP